MTVTDILDPEMAARQECLVADADDIVMMIMTQHWDISACQCWVCQAGRAAGLHPTSDFLEWRRHGYEPVHVDDQWWSYRGERRATPT